MVTYPPFPALLDPYKVKPQDANDRKFIEYSYALQKKAVSQNESMMQKILGGMVNLVVWRDMEHVSSPDRTLDKFLEQLTTNKLYQPAIILYPQIMKNDKGGLSFHIYVVMSYENGFLTTEQQLNALREMNYTHLISFFEANSSEVRVIADEHESAPGEILTGGDYSKSPDYRNISGERAIINALNVFMGNHGFGARKFEMFRKDCIAILVEEKKMLLKVYPELYLPSDKGVIPHEEVVYSYRVLADAFERRIRVIAQKDRALRVRLEEFDNKNKPIPGRLQKQDRIDALIALVVEYTGIYTDDDRINNLKPILGAIKALMAEMEKKYDKKAVKLVGEKVSELKELIIKMARTEYGLTEINSGSIFPPEAFNNMDFTRKHSRTVVDLLKKIPELCYAPRSGVATGELSGDSDVYDFTFLPLLYRVEAEKRLKKDRSGSDAVKRLIENLTSIRPRTAPYRRLLNQYNPELYMEAQKILGNLDQKAKAENIKARQEREQFEQISKIVGGIAGALGVNLVYAASVGFDPVSSLIIAVPAFGVMYGLTGYVMSSITQMKERGARKKDEKSQESEKPEEGERGGEDFFEEIKNLFPTSEENVLSRIYTPKKLGNRIKELDRFRAITDDEVRKTQMAAFKKRLASHCLTMRIPKKMIPPGYPEFLILSRSDLKSSRNRKLIAAHFKNEAEKARKHKKFSSQLLEYFGFLAQEVEFNYTRYGVK